VCCFLLAVVVIVPCTYRGVVVPVDSAEGKVFLNLLVIGWKGMMNLGSLESMSSSWFISSQDLVVRFIADLS
jgi:hypothetical protein